MLKVTIICVGKIKESYLAGGINEYAKRLSKYADLSFIELKDYADNDAVKKESELILQKLKGGFKILLDIKGKNLSSEELSELIESKKMMYSEIVFVIGGSCGVDERVKNACDFLLSFGKNTYPHQLMRMLLCEQIYRAFCIKEGTPYHK